MVTSGCESGIDDGDTPRTEAVSDRAGHSRRGVLAAVGGAVTLASLGGCFGGSNSGGGDGPEPPWTTEELADHVDDGTTVTIYSASGDKPLYDKLIDIINEEFDAGLKLDLYNSHAGAVSQRVIQERQAGKDQADVISTANDISGMIRQRGRKIAEKYYEMSIDEKFWFSDELPERNVYPWMVKTLNTGPKSVMPINEDVFEERGLDIPATYNDLFDEQYEGLRMALADYVVSHRAGYIIRTHADRTDMGRMEWMRALIDHLDFVGTDSHSTGAREVAQGNIPTMFYNGPNTLMPFMGDTGLYANFVENPKGSTWKNEMTINSEAPRPWAARLFVSAALEEPAQRRIVDEVPQAAPGRTDLDYTTSDPYMKKLLTTEFNALTFEEGEKYIETGERAKEEGVFEF